MGSALGINPSTVAIQLEYQIKFDFGLDQAQVHAKGNLKSLASLAKLLVETKVDVIRLLKHKIGNCKREKISAFSHPKYLNFNFDTFETK